MGEIHRDSVNQAVVFSVPSIVPTAAKVSRGATQMDTVLNGNAALIPYEITRFDGKFDVTWTYYVEGTTYTKTDTHEVVTPMFSKAELIEWDSDFSALSDEKFERLEGIIRVVIETITGQTYGLEHTFVSVPGSGGETLNLPKRLSTPIALNDRTGDLLDSFVYPINDGWTLKTYDGPTWVDNFYTSNPIENPWRKAGYFREDTNYVIEGYFGYDSLPNDIVTAAKILAEDYGCDESLWRDRYIANMRAADWRFEFNGKAFYGTGNVKVDQILEKYAAIRMAVL